MFDHELSPMPLFTVFLGYWLPLAWLLRGLPQLGNTTLLEKCQAIGSSVLLNFGPVAIGTALLIYLGSLLSLFTRTPYRHVVRWWMNLAANLLILATTALTIKLSILGTPTVHPLVQVSVLVVIGIISILLTARGIFLAGHLILSRWLAVVSLPLAVGFAILELLSLPRLLHENTSQSLHIINRRPPDIILITMDACASGHLSCYGSPRLTSPRMDVFASDAILFEQFYANANWKIGRAHV